MNFDLSYSPALVLFFIGIAIVVLGVFGARAEIKSISFDLRPRSHRIAAVVVGVIIALIGFALHPPEFNSDTKQAAGAGATATSAVTAVSTAGAASTPRSSERTGHDCSGFTVTGSHPNDYQLSEDMIVHHAGAYSCTLKAVASDPQPFAALVNEFPAQRYLGKRIRMSAYVRSEGVADWSGMWMRIDSPTGIKGFDNMSDRPIKGSTFWAQYEIVLDVTQDATAIVYGIILSGKGQVWIDEVNFEEVSR